jgi:translation initiation factor IF-2
MATTVIVTRGTLRPRDILIAGKSWCRVRSLKFSYTGTKSSSRLSNAAVPGQPVEITGWDSLPLAGDQILGAGNEDDAKKAIENRERRDAREKMLMDLQALNTKRQAEGEEREKEKQKEARSKERIPEENEEAGKEDKEKGTEGVRILPLVVKGDFSGTVEAIKGALESIGNSEATAKVVSTGVGDITESDVEYANACGGQSLIACQLYLA